MPQGFPSTMTIRDLKLGPASRYLTILARPAHPARSGETSRSANHTVDTPKEAPASSANTRPACLDKHSLLRQFAPPGTPEPTPPQSPPVKVKEEEDVSEEVPAETREGYMTITVSFIRPSFHVVRYAPSAHRV